MAEEVFNSKHTCANIEEILDSAGLISTQEDENYSVKIVDNDGTLLLGIKTTGELEVPIGLTDDAYNLIKALYDKLSDAIPALKQYVDSVKSYCNKTFETSADRKELIDSTTDNDYVMKLVDAEGNLLLGFKTTGEMDAPNGIPDDDYTLHQATYQKLEEIATYLQTLNERVSKLENNN